MENECIANGVRLISESGASIVMAGTRVFRTQDRDTIRKKGFCRRQWWNYCLWGTIWKLQKVAFPFSTPGTLFGKDF